MSIWKYVDFISFDAGRENQMELVSEQRWQNWKSRYAKVASAGRTEYFRVETTQREDSGELQRAPYSRMLNTDQHMYEEISVVPK